MLLTFDIAVQCAVDEALGPAANHTLVREVDLHILLILTGILLAVPSRDLSNLPRRSVQAARVIVVAAIAVVGPGLRRDRPNRQRYQ